MHKTRLNKLASTLEELKPKEQEHFDIGSWFETVTDVNLARVSKTRFLNECGTSACAMGIACLIAEFRREGLTSRQGVPSFKDRVGFQAGALFFGLNSDQSKHLFSGRRYTEPRNGAVTAAMVAQRIRTMLANA